MRVECRREMDLAGLRVLVVEDQALVALDIEALLTDEGAEVIGPATNMADALRLIGLNDVDAATVDFVLRDGRAYPLVDKLMAIKVPLVFVTACGADELPPRYGSIPRIDKPFMSKNLVDQLATLARQRPQPH